MHLQSLELFGFKSFAEKTIFNFHEGVTAIVGPNGCGKSNVCDAVRWVLGEQSAKSLRGGEMADVIFNGTDSRKPLGFAEVSLAFSDCASELGVAWHEVRVTRRIYRDGNSEYFLNKTLCRLKDIHSLFADTGIGRAAYSIMEQGKIDLILSSRPEDRRSIFEDAAGITKYKTQKKEALRKLEATEANLLRIGDIIKEVKRQIGSLQRQAGKARRYQVLHADLKVLDTHFSFRRLQALESELSECGGEIARIADGERTTRHQIEEGETKLADLRGELDEMDDRIAEARANLQRLESEISSHRSRIEFNEQRSGELNELLARSKRDIASAEGKLREQEAEIDSASALVEETARLLAQKNEQLAEFVAGANEQRESRAEIEQLLQRAQLNLSKDELRVAAIGDDLEQLRARRDSTKHDHDLLAEKIAASSSGREKLEAKVLQARVSSETEQQSVGQLLARAHSYEEEMREHQRGSVEAGKELASLLRLTAEKESRLEVLRQLNEEGEGLAKGSQALLKGEQFEFAGALAAQLDVAPEFVPAIEAALGRNLHTIIPRDHARVGEIISYLNEQQLGQAALALGELQNDPGNSSRPLPAPAIAWASDKVRAPAQLTGLVQRLLREVAIFETLEQALRARETFAGAAATLRGEFISAEGILFGGSSNTRTDSVLERKSRIDVLASELAKLTRERESAEQTQRALETKIGSAHASLENARAAHQAAHAAQAAAVSKITDLEREHHDAERDVEILSSEHRTLARQITLADERAQGLETEQAKLTDQIKSQSAEIAQLAARREESSRLEEEAIARLAELRIALATQEQKHETLSRLRAPMLARRDELAELIALRGEDIENYQARLVAQAEESKTSAGAIESQSAQRQKRESETEKLVAERAARMTTVTENESELRATRNRLSELQEQRGAQTVRQTQLQMQNEHLIEHTLERYQLDLRAFVPDSFAHEKVLRAQIKRSEKESVGEEELPKLIAELTRQLDAMGPVNLDAVQEYDELEERYKFLETQNTDLTNSRRELLDVIARINSTTQKLFAETFAQVRINFREMFAELFGGGRADLQLLDENDALNCGIEIIAKPPGKQLQSVSLLSGGERTMTAVALLFAIYMVRPSPFCVLDEMDAPLDESNINRFIKVLERFVAQSQFIIITHNKRTIAKADILYGVTMEERGVSKLVGMKLSAPRKAETNGATNAAAPESQRQFSMSEEAPRIPSLMAH